MRYADAVQSWPYTEDVIAEMTSEWDTRTSDLLSRLTQLLGKIQAMAKDPISPEERAQTAEEQRKKAEELFQKLRDEVKGKK